MPITVFLELKHPGAVRDVLALLVGAAEGTINISDVLSVHVAGLGIANEITAWGQALVPVLMFSTPLSPGTKASGQLHRGDPGFTEGATYKGRLSNP